MNGNSRQAYLNLIEVLLSCPSGEEPAILQANQNLIDAGLVQTMLDYAVNLATRDYRDYIDADNRLINIVVNLLVSLRNADEGSQEFSEAIDYYEQVRAICQERSYQQMEEMLLYYIRLFYRYTNDYAKAIESSERLLVIAQNRKERFLEAEALLHPLNAVFSLHFLTIARTFHKKALSWNATLGFVCMHQVCKDFLQQTTSLHKKKGVTLSNIQTLLIIAPRLCGLPLPGAQE